MEYKMIVRQTMFAFKQTEKGKLKLHSVKFLRDSLMKKKNDLLLVTEDSAVQFFVGGKTPLAQLTREQFWFVTAATKFFGNLPDQKQLPVWLWADSLEMSDRDFRASGIKEKEVHTEAALC